MLAIDPVAEAAGAANLAATAVGTAIGAMGAASSATAATAAPVQIVSTNTHGITDKLTTAVTSAATQSAGVAQFIKTQLNNMKMMMMNFANQARIEASNAARSAKQAVKDRALKAVDDAKNMVKQMKTFRFWVKMIKKMFRYLYYVYIIAILFKNIGLWAVRVIEVIIYRIFRFKDCFLWYILEIIGFVLYVPVEFVVWLLCLQEIEKTVWDTLEEFDCMFADATGYHFLHYSDSILQKCYSMQFPPFPMGLLPTEANGEITEASIIRFLIAWYVPPTPSEIKEMMHLIFESLRESGPIVKDAAVEFMDEIGDMFKVDKGNESDQIKGGAGSMVSI